MFLRQLFDRNSYTYTYILADKVAGKALIIDPVMEKVSLYQQLIDELELLLIYAIDTHVHADHITAIGKLRELYGCETVHGEMSRASGITKTVADGELIELDTIKLQALYTPGHTDDSYCFLLKRGPTGLLSDLLFSGDTLLIRGTGRTDFQQGDSNAQYRSLIDKILTLKDSTVVYPGHDYRGMTASTIGEEKRFNPRLQVENNFEYCRLMKELNLEKPALMEIAVPANLKCGLI